MTLVKDVLIQDAEQVVSEMEHGPGDNIITHLNMEEMNNLAEDRYLRIMLGFGAFYVIELGNVLKLRGIVYYKDTPIGTVHDSKNTDKPFLGAYVHADKGLCSFNSTSELAAAYSVFLCWTHAYDSELYDPEAELDDPDNLDELDVPLEEHVTLRVLSGLSEFPGCGME